VTLRQRCRVIAVLAVLVGVPAGTVRAAGTLAPKSVVRAYIAALDRHDGAAVCRLFAPRLRAYVAWWAAPLPPSVSCAGAVRLHFSLYYSRHRWSARRFVVR
jgi:hypothetical protein